MLTAADLDHINDFQHRLSTIPSSGNGLYAGRCFATGDPVCYFSGVVKDFPHASPLCREHELPFQGKFIVGASVPSTDHPAGVAQLVNDYAMPWLAFKDVNDNDVDRVHFIANKMVAYLEASRRSQNISRRDADSTIFIATKGLQTGDELYYSYGSTWWLEWYTARLWDDKVKRSLGFASQAFQEGVRKGGTEVEVWSEMAAARLKFVPPHIRTLADIHVELAKARNEVRLLKKVADKKRSSVQNQQLRKQSLWIQDLLEFIPQIQSHRH
jgi:hypothetical protein